LPAGVYLLTSFDCHTCTRARRRLERRRVEYDELSWQENGDTLRRLGIDAVPSLLVVEADGDARWYRGGVPPLLGNPPRERDGG
jgi:glutaredoxin